MSARRPRRAAAVVLGVVVALSALNSSGTAQEPFFKGKTGLVYGLFERGLAVPFLPGQLFVWLWYGG